MSCLNFRCNNIYNNKYYCRLCEYAHDTDDNKNDINQGKKCNECKYILCETCYLKWYEVHDPNIGFRCPNCRKSNTYKFNKKKIIPINLEKPIDNNSFIVDISDNEENDAKISCRCLTIYECQTLYHIFIYIIIFIFGIIAYFIATYHSCLTPQENLCLYCLFLSIINIILVFLIIYWIQNKIEINECSIIVISIIQSLFLIIVLSKKIQTCVWVESIMFLWMLLLCPLISWINLKSSYIKEKKDNY